MKFYHTSDIHLGAVPDGCFPWSKARGEEIYDSFVRLVDQADLEKIDLLLISGDLFHRQPLSRELQVLGELFGSLKKTQVVFITGNRDYLREDSSYRTFHFPKNVHFLDGSREKKIVFPELQTVVYGMSYTKKQLTEPLYESFRPEEEGFFSIFLVHAGDGEEHMRLHPEKLAASGFSYIALGGSHEHRVWLENRMVCAGALEPVKKEDLGEHGFVEGEWKDGFLTTRFVPFALRNYRKVVLTSESHTTEKELREKLKEVIQSEGSRDIYRVEIQGVRKPGLDFEPEHFLDLGNVVEVRDLSEPEFDLEELKKQHGQDMIGRYITYFEQQTLKDPVAKKALYCGLLALLEAEKER